MGDNLQEKNRKELKELCNQNNIRTAGVKVRAWSDIFSLELQSSLNEFNRFLVFLE